jgi:hypothetical protein
MRKESDAVQKALETDQGGVHAERWAELADTLAVLRISPEQRRSSLEALIEIPEPTRSRLLCPKAMNFLKAWKVDIAPLVVKEIMKWPTCPIAVVYDLADELARVTGDDPKVLGRLPNRHEFFDRWKFAEWARKRGYDVESEPTYSHTVQR